MNLARATRQSLLVEEHLASQRLKEGETMMELLQTTVKQAHVRVAEADLHIGTLRAMLDAEGISEVSLSDDEESTFDIIPATSSDNESDSDSTGSMYSINLYRHACLTLIAH